MRVLAVFITIGMLLTPHSANADVASDVNSNLPIKIIFDNAFSDGLSLEDIFNQIAAASQGLTPAATSYATCNKLKASDTVVSSAFNAAPKLAKGIANAARECGVTKEDLLTSALASNIDPTTIGEATAGGGNTSVGEKQINEKALLSLFLLFLRNHPN